MGALGRPDVSVRRTPAIATEGPEASGRGFGAPGGCDAIAGLFDMIAPTVGNNDLVGGRALYQLPCIVVAPEGVHPIMDDAAFESFFGAMLERMRELNYGHSTYDRLSVRTLSTTVALAAMRWTRFRADDIVLEMLGVTYTVVQRDGTWRVATLVVHGPDPVLVFG